MHNYMLVRAKFPCIMNDLLPRPWDMVAYALVLLVSLGMFVAGLGLIVSHCNGVYAVTGIPDACGTGAGWVLFCLGFLAVAAYAAWQLIGIRREKKTGE